MDEPIYVKDVMTRRGDIEVVDLTDQISDIFTKYKLHYYHSFPVLREGDKLHGVVDEDVVLIRLLYEHLPSKDFSMMLGRAEIKNVEKYIGKEIDQLCNHPITIDPDAKIEEAVAMMMKNNTDRIMVTEDERLVGVISKRDIIRKFLKKIS